MAELSYHYRKKRKLKKGWRWAIAIFVLFILLGGALIAYDIYKNQSKQQTGEAQLSQLNYDAKGPWLTVNEPTFKMQLPGDWREIRRIKNSVENSILWQSTKLKENNRYVTVYIDIIPRQLAVNKLLTVEGVGGEIRHGAISDNCAAYTNGGAIDANAALKSKVTQAKWEEVTFMCDLPKVFDNVVGTSSKEGINIVSVTGEEKGTHKYFFTYTDHNAHPNYDIFTDMLDSFSAL